ncbi:IS4 family transposase [Thiofilum sp.]|uniref:IS4 family transposase n=2 Tax=Thiofilum sp. TaxID=2212733 RepID=UPI0025FA58BA|nr:IS4 family transposase [Thiofilum sp.]
MDLSDGLRDSLKAHLSWGKPRLDCFVGMLHTLLSARQMNLALLAVHIDSDTDIGSRYRRMQRFFSQVFFNYNDIAHFLMGMFAFSGQQYYLTLDRTNWKWGKSNLNLLTLAVVYQGAAIPVYWMVLNKRGNSNQRERIALLQRFISQFGRNNILGVLADREFIGGQWWKWLSSKEIPYLIRIKGNQLMTDKHKKEAHVRSLFANLKPGKRRVLRHRRDVSGEWVWLSGSKLPSGELLIIASNHYTADPIGTYRLRWEIENLFQCLKGRGFHMEATHFTKPPRIKKMMALLAIGFCWAHKVGEWKEKAVKPLKTKKHGRKEQSVFRYGLDYLTDLLNGRVREKVDRLRLLLLFLCPPQFMAIEDGRMKLRRFSFEKDSMS